MHRKGTCLALALGMALGGPMAAAAIPAARDERLHVEFPSEMPAFVQTSAAGGRDIDETPAMSYGHRASRGEPVRPPVGYAVKPAPAGCDKPGIPCPARRDALRDDRADDLPAGFTVEIADDPDAERMRAPLRSSDLYRDGPGPWTAAPHGRWPYPPFGAGTARVLSTVDGKLRPGALAQADCFDGLKLCAVRISYSRDLRVNFMSPETGEALARQVEAVDAVMQLAIRTGPMPEPRIVPPPRPSAESQIAPFHLPGMPIDLIRAKANSQR